MSFLVPSILWGLIAATIPLLIHLFSIRKTQRVNFSAVRFIKELEHETIRKLKLRQWLLLILRTLAIIFIILAFARPVKVGYFPPWAAGDRSTKMVVLIDNSASMSALYKDETLLDWSKKNLIHILQSVEGKIYLDIFQTTPLENRFSGEFISPDEISPILSGIEPTYEKDNLWNKINDILEEVSFESRGTPKNANKEFYILSDFPATIPKDWYPITGDSLKEENSWRYFLILPYEVEDNLSIQSVDVLTQLRIPGQFIQVVTKIQHYGDETHGNIPIQLFFDEDRVGQVVSDLPPLNAKEFIFQAFAKHSGIVHGEVEIPDDFYTADNQKYFQFFVPKRINCTLIGPSKTSLILMETALNAINKDSLFVNYQSVISKENSPLLLQNSDVVILIDPWLLSTHYISEINKFLQRGGGLVVFLGEGFVKVGNMGISEMFALPKLTELIKLPDNVYFEVEQIEENHPLFSTFSVKNLKKEMPQIYSHVQISVGKGWKSLLTLSSGDPLLMETNVKKGKVLAFSVLPDLRWTDLPIRGIFVPLVHRMLHYLYSNKEMIKTVTVGEKVEIPISRSFLSSEIEMHSPSGRRTLLVPDYRREVVIIDKVRELGIYRLMVEGREINSFVANVAESENPAYRLSLKELRTHFPSNRTRIVSWDENIVEAVIEARRGTELWRSFIIAALIILGIETYIGRIRKESMGK